METIIIVGCGSIGQRHAINAHKIGIKNIVLCDLDADRIKEFSNQVGTNLLYSSYEEAYLNHPEIEAAIISTPSGLHIEPAIFFAKNGVNLFVEKPLSNNLEGIEDLLQIVGEKKIVAMMGQSYRFHEGFIELKKLLDEEVVGKIYHVNYYGGSYLPEWHPDEDYRKEYAAQKQLGGGVLLTSFSHTFDTINWLFGNIIRLTGWKAKLGDLEIDVEDYFSALAETDKGIVVQSQSDFLQINRHQIIINGKDGYLEADLIKNEITVQLRNQTPQIIHYNFDPNKRYVDEIMHFRELVQNRTTKHGLDLKVGKNVLELIESKDIEFIGN